ncbi:MAG: cytochrome c biogenesis protein CcsA, partial [Duncaniella sp.]|nr:cytochrome c biogenesis protein CcsA [Duncaniella sp.]
VAYLWLWFISRSFPLSTTSEMMEFLGVTAAIIATFICRRKDSVLLTGLVMAGTSFLFLVSWLGVKDPVMSPVMPVLASPWLAVHVSLIMVAYAILGFTLPTSVIALIRPRQRERLTALSMSLLGPGVYILGLGIIVGAMWANVSWGRYWAWDPKETWALVTLLLYSIPLHRWFGLRNYPRICNIYLIVIFSAIIMTYYGVNFLPSLHAYK